MTATASASPDPDTAHGPRQGRQARRRRLTVLMQVGLTVVALVIWDLVIRAGLIHEIIVPAPADVARSVVDLLDQATFWHHTRVTVVETLIGFALGGFVGFALGAWLGISEAVRRVLFPYVVAFQGLPKVVLAPVFVTALGFGIWSKIAMAVVLAFFPVLINTMVGLTSVDPEQIRLLRSYRASRWQTFRKLTLPNAVPYVFAGLKTSLTFALIGAIVGEFVGAADGLGYLLNLYAFQLRIPDVWAIMVVLAVIGVILYWIIEWVDRRIVFWRTERQLSAGM